MTLTAAASNGSVIVRRTGAVVNAVCGVTVGAELSGSSLTSADCIRHHKWIQEGAVITVAGAAVTLMQAIEICLVNQCPCTREATISRITGVTQGAASI